MAILATFIVPLWARATTPEDVDAALEKAKAFIYSQEKDGNWEESPTPTAKTPHWGGFTAISTYALLAAGENAQDPRLMSAIEFLQKAKADIKSIYVLGIRAQVWNLVPDSPQVRAAAKLDAELLLKAVGTKGPEKGFYAYTTSPGFYHHSPSQYGVLGMWACAQEGVEVPSKYWSLIEEAWRGTQQSDGGWSYTLKPTDKAPVKASMTAAGVATLFITQDYLHGSEISTKGNVINNPIENGMAWMGKNFATVKDLYTWYGVERIGVASGYKYFGTTDWYAVGSDAVVKTRGSNGSLGGSIPNTCFGVLFLSRGRAPVVLNKVSYEVGGKQGNWNQRPRDAANVVRWLAKTTERDLNWQIVNLGVPAEELHDSPILYFTGNQALDFSDEQEAKLKKYLEQGGIILANAEAGAAVFSTSIRKLGEKLFPDYKWRELPEDHVIYKDEQFHRTKWHVKPSVLALSNGVREMILLLPTTDPGKNWQLQGSTTQSEAFELMSDIFLYSVDKKNLLYKGQTYVVKENPAAKAERTIKVARLKYDGNWNPEPGGWQRLTTILRNQNHVQMVVEPVTLGEGKLAPSAAAAAPSAPRPSDKELRQAAFKRILPADVLATSGDQDKLNELIQKKMAEMEAERKTEDDSRSASQANYKMAHLTGTGKLELTAAQTGELKKFVESGGTLVIDAAGGTGEFGDSTQQMLDIFGADAKQLSEELPEDHAIYTLPGLKIEEFKYRTFARKILNNRVKGPHLRGIQVNGRLAVILSREDLSAGMVGQPVDGVNGYDPATATALMTNLVLFGAFGNKAGTVAAKVAPTSAPAAGAAPAATKLVTPLDVFQKPEGTNLALHKKYECSDINKASWGANLTDGSWEATGAHCFATGLTDNFPKTVTIDLEQTASIASAIVGVPPFGSTKTITVSVSEDGKTFKDVGSHAFTQSKQELYAYNFEPVKARYVRLTYPDHYDPKVNYPNTFAFTIEVEIYASPVKPK